MSAHIMQQAMEADGLQPGEQIIPDGIFHRIDDIAGKGSNKLIGYVCYGSAGYYCHWSKMPEGRKWSVKNETEFTTEERKQYAIQMQQAREYRAKAEAQRHTECRQRSAIIWNESPFATDDHPYLVKKGIKANGAKVHKSRLVVPVYDVEDTLHGLQYIDADGVKKFEPGTAVKGHFSYIAGDNILPICITEGFATGATIHEVTGATVVIAFSCGNLQPVSEVIWKRVGGAK